MIFDSRKALCLAVKSDGFQHARCKMRRHPAQASCDIKTSKLGLLAPNIEPNDQHLVIRTMISTHWSCNGRAAQMLVRARGLGLAVHEIFHVACLFFGDTQGYSVAELCRLPGRLIFVVNKYLYYIYICIYTCWCFRKLDPTLRTYKHGARKQITHYKTISSYAKS